MKRVMAKQFNGIILTLIVKSYRLHPYFLLPHNIKARFGLLNLSTLQTLRKYCNDAKLNKECNDQEVDKKCINLCENKDPSLVNDISKMFSIDINDALQIYNEFCEIKRLSKKDIINILTIVKKAGISTHMIHRHIPTFVHNMEFLDNKLFCIACLNDNIDEMLPLLNISLKYLNILIVNEIHVERNRGVNKIRYLAKELGCSVYRLCQLIENEPSVVTLSFNRIKTVVNVLKEYNYEQRDILNNLWLFKYSPRTIRRRSSAVKLAGVNIVKSWVVRCSINGLHRYIYVLKKEVQLHNVYGSHVSLLSTKLNITEEEVEFYIKRCPSILEVQLDKVNEVLDILLEYGYHAGEILMCQRVFLIKTSILKERLKRLQEIRGPHRLTLIYCSSKVFENTVAFANKIYNTENS